MDNYKDRLAQALKARSVTDTQLAKHLEISIQAVRKVAAGKTIAFTAENNSKAAKFLRVDPDWLATGEGEPTPSVAPKDWPLKTLTYAEFVALPEQFHAGVDNFAAPYVNTSQTPMHVGQNPIENVSNREPKSYVFVDHELRKESNGPGHSDQNERAKPATRKSAGNR